MKPRLQDEELYKYQQEERDEMPEVKVDDVKIHYELHGEGIPLLLINGWCLSSDTWDSELIKNLSTSYKVITFDNRGIGRSGKPETTYSTTLMAKDAKHVLDAVHVKKTHVLGFSMGGQIAQELALNYPEHVQSLILCGSLCGGPSTKLTQDVWTLMGTLAGEDPIEMSVQEVMQHFFGLVWTPRFLQENMEELMAMFGSPPPMYVIQRHTQAVAGHNASERLHEIAVPTLILTAEKDIMILPENSTILADGISDAKLHTFSDTGHMFLWEKRDEAVPVLLDFLLKA